MKVVSLVVLSTMFAMGQVYADDAAPKTDKDKVSYSIGFGMGSNLKNQGVDVDADKLAKGIKDALSGAKPMMSDGRHG